MVNWDKIQSKRTILCMHICLHTYLHNVYTHRKGLEFLSIATFPLPGEFPLEEANIKKTYSQMNHSAPPLTLNLQQRYKDFDLIQLPRPKHLIPFDY